MTPIFVFTVLQRHGAVIHECGEFSDARRYEQWTSHGLIQIDFNVGYEELKSFISRL
jgi:hypothetical protein